MRTERQRNNKIPNIFCGFKIICVATEESQKPLENNTKWSKNLYQTVSNLGNNVPKE
jgi:hypothetical protein